MPNMEYVDSSNVEQVGYDEVNMELHIVFKGSPGSVYVYLNVPSAKFEELLAAESKGSYFNREIKNVFETVRR